MYSAHPTLAATSADTTVRLWNVAYLAHPTPLGQPLTGHTGPVLSVVFSHDGHTLASASNENTVRLWEMDVKQVIQRICATTTNAVTAVTWKQVMPSDLSYRPPYP